MISYVRGTVAGLNLDSAVIDVGGIGFSLVCTPATLAKLRKGEVATLASTLIVREDSLTLFGFQDDDERDVFEILQTVSGVGPRLAQAMLGVHKPDTLRRAVATEDFATLEQVPGIGRKSAQRLVLELKGRIGAPIGVSENSVGPALVGPGSWRMQVHSALVGLGWSGREADSAIEAVTPLGDEGVPVPALLREALKSLARST